METFEKLSNKDSECLNNLTIEADKRSKPKRRRKEWVYKSEYDKLREKYENARMLACLGWALAISTIILITLW